MKTAKIVLGIMFAIIGVISITSYDSAPNTLLAIITSFTIAVLLFISAFRPRKSKKYQDVNYQKKQGCMYSLCMVIQSFMVVVLGLTFVGCVHVLINGGSVSNSSKQTDILFTVMLGFFTAIFCYNMVRMHKKRKSSYQQDFEPDNHPTEAPAPSTNTTIIPPHTKSIESENHKLQSSNFYAGADFFNKLQVHPDLKDLLWIGSGPYCNYTVKEHSATNINMSGISFRIAFSPLLEPSLLYPELPIEEIEADEVIESPSYFPNYSELTPKQRWKYWMFLSDPYNPQNDIGYVFILYYGLERHLIEGNGEQAFRVILKLRNTYSNKSFQAYSAATLMLYCMAQRRMDLAFEFVNSIDESYELNVPVNLYVLFKYGLGMSLSSKELLHFHRSFGFTNNRYIKNNRQCYLNHLENNLKEEFAIDSINLAKYFDDVDLNGLPKQIECCFANVSISSREIFLPVMVEYEPFRADMFRILSKAHEDTKADLAAQRKRTTSPVK